MFVCVAVFFFFEMQRTYGKKKTDEAGVVAAAPLSPPKKKKSVWAGFVGLKRRPAFCASSSSSSSSVSGAAALSDDGEDEEEEQAFLDSELTYCEYCRMRYSRGIAADETLHRRHCKRFRFGEKWPSGLKEVGSVVRNYPDGTRVVYVAEVDNMKDDSAPKRVMEVVDLELGFAGKLCLCLFVFFFFKFPILILRWGCAWRRVNEK